MSFCLEHFIWLPINHKDVLDINAGTWTRVLPSGDPGTTGIQTFPSPREGASVLSYQTGLVGPARNSSADTIVSFHDIIDFGNSYARKDVRRS